MGLDQAEHLCFGAAPMPGKTRNFFFDMNMFINNVFGMSETSGPATALTPENYDKYDLKSAGIALKGTETIILPDTGELCMRGRNIFMGYLKNEEATRGAIDIQRRVHSGDIARKDEDGNVFITGRIKELLVTAGGENVAPIIIENIAKEELPFISNIMLIGDQRKFVSALISLRTTSLASDPPNRELAPELLEYLSKQGITGLTTVDEAVQSEAVIKLIQKGKSFFDF